MQSQMIYRCREARFSRPWCLPALASSPEHSSRFRRVSQVTIFGQLVQSAAAAGTGPWQFPKLSSPSRSQRLW